MSGVPVSYSQFDSASLDGILMVPERFKMKV